MLCYANVQEAVQDDKTKTNMGCMKTKMTRKEFKWTAVVIIISVVILTVVLPTVLEVTKQGNCYNLIISNPVFTDKLMETGIYTAFIRRFQRGLDYKNIS